MSSLYVKLSSGSPGHLNKTQILSWVPEALLSGLSSLSKLPVDHAVAPDPLLPEHPALTPSALRLLCPPPGTPCEQIRLLLRVLGEASPPGHLLSHYPLPGSVVLVSLPDTVLFMHSFPGSRTAPPAPCTVCSSQGRALPAAPQSLELCLACSGCSENICLVNVGSA